MEGMGVGGERGRCGGGQRGRQGGGVAAPMGVLLKSPEAGRSGVRWTKVDRVNPIQLIHLTTTIFNMPIVHDT